MEKSEIIGSVAKDLHNTECAVDAAITQATTLVQAMIGARSVLSISPVGFSASQSKAMEAIAALAVARDAMVACHADLAKDHRRMGWGTYNVGPLNKPDDMTRPIESPWRRDQAA